MSCRSFPTEQVDTVVVVGCPAAELMSRPLLLLGEGGGGGAAAGICASYEITRDVAACLTHLPGLSFSVQMQCITMAILPNLPTPQELNADTDIWAVLTTTHVINQTLPPPLVQDWIVTYGIDLITQSSDNLFVSRQVYWDSSTSSSSQGRDIIVIIVRKLLFISL